MKCEIENNLYFKLALQNCTLKENGLSKTVYPNCFKCPRLLYKWCYTLNQQDFHIENWSFYACVVECFIYIYLHSLQFACCEGVFFMMYGH